MLHVAMGKAQGDPRRATLAPLAVRRFSPRNKRNSRTRWESDWYKRQTDGLGLTSTPPALPNHLPTDAGRRLRSPQDERNTPRSCHLSLMSDCYAIAHVVGYQNPRVAGSESWGKRNKS